MKKIAFTLAEVLITLAIIGVVAAMTIPTLISKYQEKSVITHLYKNYSIINNAFKLARYDYGSPKTWNLGERGNKDGADKLVEIFSKYIAVINTRKDSSNNTIMQLKDGTEISFYVASPNCSYASSYFGLDSGICADIYIKFPNKNSSTNSFEFMMFEDRISAYGNDDIAKTDNARYWFSFDAYKAGRCSSCSAGWLMKYKNMDYLHCPEKLSWNGKHSCNE